MQPSKCEVRSVQYMRKRGPVFTVRRPVIVVPGPNEHGGKQCRALGARTERDLERGSAVYVRERAFVSDVEDGARELLREQVGDAASDERARTAYACSSWNR